MNALHLFMSNSTHEMIKGLSIGLALLAKRYQETFDDVKPDEPHALEKRSYYKGRVDSYTQMIASLHVIGEVETLCAEMAERLTEVTDYSKN